MIPRQSKSNAEDFQLLVPQIFASRPYKLTVFDKVSMLNASIPHSPTGPGLAAFSALIQSVHSPKTERKRYYGSDPLRRTKKDSLVVICPW